MTCLNEQQSQTMLPEHNNRNKINSNINLLTSRILELMRAPHVLCLAIGLGYTLPIIQIAPLDVWMPFEHDR